MPRGTGLRMLAALGAARALVLPQRVARSLTRRLATDTERGAPKLPKGQFRPKQSLGQNYLQDPNYAARIVDALQCDSERGKRVVELGPGLGALTKLLSKEYP